MVQVQVGGAGSSTFAGKPFESTGFVILGGQAGTGSGTPLGIPSVTSSAGISTSAGQFLETITSLLIGAGVTGTVSVLSPSETIVPPGAICVAGAGIPAKTEQIIHLGGGVDTSAASRPSEAIGFVVPGGAVQALVTPYLTQGFYGGVATTSAGTSIFLTVGANELGAAIKALAGIAKVHVQFPQTVEFVRVTVRVAPMIYK